MKLDVINFLAKAMVRHLFGTDSICPITLFWMHFYTVRSESARKFGLTNNHHSMVSVWRFSSVFLNLSIPFMLSLGL